jgi:nitrous oxidase accessory protein NosD
MKIALDFVREKMGILLTRIDDSEYENLVEVSHFYNNISTLKNKLKNNSFEDFRLKIFFQRVITGREIDFQKFLPTNVQYPFNKQQFEKMSREVHTKIWGEYSFAQNNAMLDDYEIVEMPEQEWEFLKNNANDLGF